MPVTTYPKWQGPDQEDLTAFLYFTLFSIADQLDKTNIYAGQAHKMLCFQLSPIPGSPD